MATATAMQTRSETRATPQQKAAPRGTVLTRAAAAGNTLQQILGLQRSAGNQSVLPGAGETGIINLNIGGVEFRGVTTEEALIILGRHQSRVHSRIESAYNWHADLMALQRDQPIVAYFAEAFGRVDMPEIDIWDQPRSLALAAKTAIKSGSVNDAVIRIIAAVAVFESSYKIFAEYRDGTLTGAERAVTGLKITAAAGAVAATVASGGLAGAGAGLLGTSAAAGTGAGVYGATQEFSGQASEVYLAETREGFDVGAIFKRGASDAIAGFVGSVAGGALAKQFTKLFGSYLGNIGDDALRELGKALGQKGPLPRDFFVTGGQRFIADFLAGVGTTPLTAAVTTAVDGLTGSSEIPSMSEFLDTVVDEMVQGGAIDIFLAAVTRGKGAHGGRSKPRKGKNSRSKASTSKKVPEGKGSRPMKEVSSSKKRDSKSATRQSDTASSDAVPSAKKATADVVKSAPEAAAPARTRKKQAVSRKGANELGKTKIDKKKSPEARKAKQRTTSDKLKRVGPKTTPDRVPRIKQDGTRRKGAKQMADVGLAGRGYKPKPGERSATKQQYKRAEGARRWAKAVDEAFEGDISGIYEVPQVKGRKKPTIDGKRVPTGDPNKKKNLGNYLDLGTLPLKPGENQTQALVRIRTVIGKKLSDVSALNKHWNDARASTLRKNNLTKSNYAKLYERTRRSFWRRVRGDPAARQILRDSGFGLPGGKSTAPVLENIPGSVPVSETRISLDHLQEKAQGNNWRKALDADNLQMEFAQPNTEREIKQMRHPELR